MHVRSCRIAIAVLASLVAVPPASALAQERPAPVVELIAGDAAFVDEVWDHFLLLGGGGRAYVTPRVAIGAEIAHMWSRDESSNLSLTGNLTFDLVRDTGTRRLVPYVVVAGGILRQRTIVGSGPGSTVLQPFVSTDGQVSAGIGSRVSLGPRVYVAPEFRIGWEPETRLTVTLGIKL